MRLRLCISLLCLATLAQTAHAESIRTQSGEHKDFSRLVFSTSSTAKLTVTRQPDGYLLNFDGSEMDFRLGQVFTFIPRTRIKDIRQSAPSQLKIISDCDCHFETSQLKTGQIIFDLHDGPGPAAQTTDIASVSPDETPDSKRAGLPLSVLRHARDISLEDESPTTSQPKPKTNRSGLTVEALSEHLAKAAAQGLVELAPVEVPLPQSQPETPEPSKYVDDANEPEPQTRSHITIQTSVDRDAPTTSSFPIGDDAACWDPEIFEVETWSEHQGERVFAPSENLFIREFDRVDVKRLNGFVRHQLYLTLGWEARQLIIMFPNKIEDAQHLLRIAEILDEGRANNISGAASQLGCDSAAALWAALALPALPPNQKVATKAILAEFSRLPTHWRILLGPTLAQRFLDRADTQTANDIKLATDRIAKSTTTAQQLVDAQLDLKAGKQTAALETYQDVARQDDTNAPAALLRLVDTKIDGGIPVTEGTLSQIAALALEHEGTQTGYELLIAESRVLFQMSRFFDGFAIYDQLRTAPASLQPQRDKTLDFAARRLAEHASEETFLRIALSDRGWDQTSTTAKRLLAERLLELGLHASATELLTQPDHPPDRGERELLARAALQANKPRVALGYLAGLRTEPARFMTSEALQKSDQMQAAAQILMELGRPEDAERVLWQSGNWADIASRQESDLASAARLAIMPIERLPDDVPITLEMARNIISGSEDLRRTLADIMARFPSL